MPTEFKQIIVNGEEYKVPSEVAEELLNLRKNEKEAFEKEEDKDKKDMEHEKDKDKKDMEHEEDKDKEDKETEEEGEGEKRELAKKLNSLQKQLDSLKGQNRALKTKLNSGKEVELENKRVSEKIKIINQASRILRVNSDKLVDKTALEIKKEVINHIDPEVKTDGKSEDFIDGMYYSHVSNEGEAYTKLLDQISEYEEREVTKAPEGADIKQNMEHESFEKRKNAWQAWGEKNSTLKEA